MKNVNPTQTQAWNELNNHFKEIKNVQISDLFDHDPNRFKNFSLSFNDQIVVDFSKNRITHKTIKKLLNLANETYVLNAIQAMFNGEKINQTENRASLHIALRNRTNNAIFVDNYNIMPKINCILNKMKVFSNAVINGAWKGYTGKSINNIVNIGIGGSDLGPKMVIEALRPYKNHLNIYYVSNVDGSNLSEVLKLVHPENTLFLIASKTFTTIETMLNANSAKKWFLEHALHSKFISQHFFAASQNLKEVIKFGISKSNYFEFWDWVGGRYSLWSSAGLSIMLSIGYNNYINLLEGAHSMDQHFLNTEFKDNIPILLALIGIWYNNFFKFETEAILPYDEYLRLFPSYFQQGNMESNGKSIDRNGKRVQWQTGPIIWGERGTNGQHAFYQLLHQGTKIVPCDFIAPILTHNLIHDHHLYLLSNFFAQTQALAFGSNTKFFGNNLRVDISNYKENYSAIFQIFEGNRPTNSILLKKITPYSLGLLIAMYEHKIFVQGVILNIFSFDQWGVELGKNLAKNIINDLRSNTHVTNYDDSTNHLIKLYKLWK